MLASRKPTAAERVWMDGIQQLGCIVCRKQWGAFSPAEIHHIEGKTDTDAHFKTLPLCYMHHRGLRYGKNEGVVSRHPYKARFEDEYGTERELWEYVCELMQEKPCHFE